MNNILNILIPTLLENSSEYIYTFLRPFSKPQKFCFYWYTIKEEDVFWCYIYVETEPFDKIVSHQRDFMHSLSDKVLLRYYDSQFPSSETGNFESWVALVLEFLNLG